MSQSGKKKETGGVEKELEMKEGRRSVSEDERKVLHWLRSGRVGCCEQRRYTCWRAPEKLTVLVDWGPPGEANLSRKGNTDSMALFWPSTSHYRRT